MGQYHEVFIKKVQFVNGQNKFKKETTKNMAQCTFRFGWILSGLEQLEVVGMGQGLELGCLFDLPDHSTSSVHTEC